MPKQKNKQDLETLIKKNTKKTDLLIDKIEKLEKDFKRFQFMNFLRFLIVVIPIILALLYLIPLFRDFLRVYEPVLEILQQLGTI
jgi:hypothetical protein